VEAVIQADIVSIGDELLIGQTVNTNAAWMGERLNAEGIRVHRITGISDQQSEILRALDECAARSSIVLITGGLGPTKDDVTKHTLCDYFQSHLELHTPTLERITEFFTSRGLPMLDVNRDQALMPHNAVVLENQRGTANGMWFERNGTVFVSMPGVPYEMVWLMEHEVMPRLLAYFRRPAIVHRTILTQGVGESFLAKKISEWETSLSEVSIALAYLPSPGQVKLRMSMYGVADEQEMRRRIQVKEKELHSLIGEHIFGYEKDTLSSVVGTLLAQRQQTLTIAESCTGGYLAHQVTSTPGASAYFNGSLITYAEERKSAILGVPAALIGEKGVVSEEVAIAMAAGARKLMNADYALSTTGIAGPDGGTEEVPVGTIWIGLDGPAGARAAKFRFGQNRERNIQMAAQSALNLLRKEILGLNG
jgi:nicotinamide-nucleotide amidase